jgi:hypothetical protein
LNLTIHVFSATGYDNIYALKAVAKDPEELENLGIDQVVPRRRICKTLQVRAPARESLVPYDTAISLANAIH